MKNVLTGITSSGKPHLGNILGAIMPGIELSKSTGYQCYYFISDLHSLTTIKNAKKREEYRNSIAAAWLAFGLDTSNHYFYRQSKIPEICELAWFLNCFTPYPMLANSHAFKSKSDNLSIINAGLLTYPVLMAADILLFDADLVPVGKDQKQHIEIARNIAKKFNHQHPNTFTVPNSLIKKNIETIPGIDGRKMSKSYDNYIDIFSTDKQLKKQIMKIDTESVSLESSKNPDNCTVFKIYSLLAESSMVQDLREKYLHGGFGFGEAKEMLFELIISKFKDERDIYNFYISSPDKIEQELKKGEERVRNIARKKIITIRSKLGY